MAGVGRGFNLPDEWPQLEDAIGDLDQSAALSGVLNLVRDHEPTRALLEVEYIDADYRNEYSNFYALTFRKVSDRCRRLHFFKRIGDGPRERYLGFSVLRPIRSRPVGRTFIVPPTEMRQYVSCMTGTTTHPYGEQLQVRAFPFMEQDAQFGVCAHASVWMAAVYHHLAHRTPRRFLSDVATAANARLEYWRPTPSEGLSDEQVGAALQEINLPPITYAVADPPGGQSARQVICRYLNSRLPVILTTKDHATVLIGYGRDTDGNLFFIRSDEGEAPYVKVYEGQDELGEWDLLFAPMPGRIYLPAESAELEARNLFTSLLRRPEHAGLKAEMPEYLRLRTYVQRAGDYKVRLERRQMPSDAVVSHRAVPTSHWLWVVELQHPELSKTTRNCVLGEIAIDATSDRLDPNPLFGNLMDWTYTWTDGRRDPSRQKVDFAGPYQSDTAIHDAPLAPPPPPSPPPSRAQRFSEFFRNLG